MGGYYGFTHLKLNLHYRKNTKDDKKCFWPDQTLVEIVFVVIVDVVIVVAAAVIC